MFILKYGYNKCMFTKLIFFLLLTSFENSIQDKADFVKKFTKKSPIHYKSDSSEMLSPVGLYFKVIIYNYTLYMMYKLYTPNQQ